MAQLIPDTFTRVLDVGCGAGRFGAYLRERNGVEVWGVEMNLAAAAEARTRMDRVLVGSIEESLSELSQGYFDCIVFNDILEHVEDPSWILREVQPLLSPRGQIVASVPNLRYWRVIYDLLVMKEFRYGTHGVMDETHRWFFTERSIRRMFRQSGLTVAMCRGINPTGSRKFRLVNLLLGGAISDMAFHQFAIVARPRRCSER